MASVPEDFKIWEGLLEEFPDQAELDGFVNPRMLRRSEERGIIECRAVADGLPIADISVFNQYPLSVVVAMLSPRAPIDVLDFGGGLGRAYLSVKATVRGEMGFHFYVLELGPICEAGRGIFADDPNIEFVGSFDELPQQLDLVHAGSAFQYVNDWKRLLENFAGLGPEYIVFGNLLAGDIEPCVTLQNVRGHKVPVRFHNFDTVIRELDELGYSLVFNAFHEQMILGQRQPLPLAHFPVKHRLVYGRNVILRRR